MLIAEEILRIRPISGTLKIETDFSSGGIELYRLRLNFPVDSRVINFTTRRYNFARVNFLELNAVNPDLSGLKGILCQLFMTKSIKPFM